MSEVLPDIQIDTARKALSHYLSDLFRVQIFLPESLGKEFDGTADEHSFGTFIQLLPTVRQRAVNDKFVDFLLPLVSKPIHLTKAVGDVINNLLADGHLTAFEVPTFFYPDGSTMVVKFDPIFLAQAISILALHPEYLECLGFGKGGT